MLPLALQTDMTLNEVQNPPLSAVQILCTCMMYVCPSAITLQYTGSHFSAQLARYARSNVWAAIFLLRNSYKHMEYCRTLHNIPRCH